MSKIEMYKPEFQVPDIFKALKNLKKDELLSQDGALVYFYQNAQYPGISLFLRHKNRVKFFYTDHDDFIIEIRDQKPEWDLAIDGNLARISLIYTGHNNKGVINFVFDLADESYRGLLDIIRKKKEIKLYYLTLLYGGIVFDSYIRLAVPDKILSALKKIK